MCSFMFTLTRLNEFGEKVTCISFTPLCSRVYRPILQGEAVPVCAGGGVGVCRYVCVCGGGGVKASVGVRWERASRNL